LDNVTYQPLPGRGFGPFRRDRVFLADDHLLSVRSSRILDIYERFYFQDIQGIYFRDRYSEYLMMLAACLIPCISLLALALLHHWGWAVPLIPILAWTLTYALLGSQGECHAQTLLGTHPVPAISRRPAYDRLLERVAPLIEAAQGPFDAVSLEVAPPTISNLAPPPMEPLAPQKQPNRGWYFEAAFITVALAGIFSMWNQRGWHGVFVDWTEYGLSFGGLVLVLMGLAKAYRVDVGGGVLACLWSMITTQAIYGTGVAIAASLQSASPRLTGGPRYLDQHPIRLLPDLLPYATAMEGLCVVLAIAGLLLIMDRKNRMPA
jgi:hypothetical protein